MESKKDELSIKFDKIFSQRTTYEDLNKRIELTMTKKEYFQLNSFTSYIIVLDKDHRFYITEKKHM